MRNKKNLARFLRQSGLEAKISIGGKNKKSPKITVLLFHYEILNLMSISCFVLHFFDKSIHKQFNILLFYLKNLLMAILFAVITLTTSMINYIAAGVLFIYCGNYNNQY